jgi:hypothetical protein
LSGVFVLGHRGHRLNYQLGFVFVDPPFPQTGQRGGQSPGQGQRQAQLLRGPGWGQGEFRRDLGHGQVIPRQPPPAPSFRCGSLAARVVRGGLGGVHHRALEQDLDQPQPGREHLRGDQFRIRQRRDQVEITQPAPVLGHRRIRGPDQRDHRGQTRGHTGTRRLRAAGSVKPAICGHVYETIHTHRQFRNPPANLWTTSKACG